MGGRLCSSSSTTSYHQEVIEEEDLPLVHPGPLRSVGVRDLVQLAAAHQPTVGEGQHLLGGGEGEPSVYGDNVWPLYVTTTGMTAAGDQSVSVVTDRLLAHDDSLHRLYLGDVVVVGA